MTTTYGGVFPVYATTPCPHPPAGTATYDCLYLSIYTLHDIPRPLALPGAISIYVLSALLGRRRRGRTAALTWGPHRRPTRASYLPAYHSVTHPTTPAHSYPTTPTHTYPTTPTTTLLQHRPLLSSTTRGTDGQGARASGEALEPQLAPPAPPRERRRRARARRHAGAPALALTSLPCARWATPSATPTRR